MLIAAATLSACAAPIAEIPSDRIAEESDARPARSAKSRVSTELLAIYDNWSAGQAGESVDGSPPPDSPAAIRSSARLRDGRVLVDCAADGDPEALAAALTELGMSDIAVFKRVVSGWLPIAAVRLLEQLDTLRFARASAARTH